MKQSGFDRLKAKITISPQLGYCTNGSNAEYLSKDVS
jgi:hypothetical protein